MKSHNVVADPAAPIQVRVAAAEELGYEITPRPSEERPRKVIFRNPETGERYTHMFPRGKGAYRRLRDAAQQRQNNLQPI